MASAKAGLVVGPLRPFVLTNGLSLGPKFLVTLNLQNQLRNKPHLHIKGANASVTFALLRVYDARTMSKSPFPYRLRRETLRSSYGFTGIVASTILFNSAQ